MSVRAVLIVTLSLAASSAHGAGISTWTDGLKIVGKSGREAEGLLLELGAQQQPELAGVVGRPDLVPCSRVVRYTVPRVGGSAGTYDGLVYQVIIGPSETIGDDAAVDRFVRDLGTKLSTTPSTSRKSTTQRVADFLVGDVKLAFTFGLLDQRWQIAMVAVTMVDVVEAGRTCRPYGGPPSSDASPEASASANHVLDRASRLALLYPAPPAPERDGTASLEGALKGFADCTVSIGDLRAHAVRVAKAIPNGEIDDFIVSEEAFGLPVAAISITNSTWLYYSIVVDLPVSATRARIKRAFPGGKFTPSIKKLTPKTTWIGCEEG